MNTARIGVMTIAVGAGGIAALASGSDARPLPTDPVTQSVDVPERSETSARARQASLLTRALHNIVDFNMAGNISGDQAPKRRTSINAVRYGVSSPTTTRI